MKKEEFQHLAIIRKRVELLKGKVERQQATVREQEQELPAFEWALQKLYPKTQREAG